MTDVEARDTHARSAIAPGWYQDPAAADAARWWNGSAWTQHTRPKPRAATPPHPVAPAATPLAPSGTTVSDVPQIPAPPWAVSALQHPGVQRAGHRSGLVRAAVEPERIPMWGPAGTVEGWVIAALPFPALIVSALVAGILYPVAPATAGAMFVVGPAIAGLVAVILAVRDARALRGRGVPRPAGAGWMLLVSPVVYLAVRASRIRAAGRRAIGPVILGAVSLAASTLVVGSVLAVALTQAVGMAQASVDGPYDPNGVLKPGAVSDRGSVAGWLAPRMHGDIVDCGIGSVPPSSLIRCTTAPDRSSPPDHEIDVATDTTGGIARYRTTDLDPRATPRSGDSADARGATTGIGFEPLVVTVPSGPFDAAGGVASGAKPTGAEVDAFIAANAQAAGLDWSVDENAVPLDDGLAGIHRLRDSRGTVWQVMVVPADGHRVYVWAEVA